MPRPKRPERIRHRFGVDFDLPLPPRVSVQVDRLIDDFVASWHRQSKRGRRPEDRRNKLINDLAALFQEHCRWELRYQEESADYLKEYRAGLRTFLVTVLMANAIEFPTRMVLLRPPVDPKYRKPRS